jgi:hypothetical protein
MTLTRVRRGGLDMYPAPWLAQGLHAHMLYPKGESRSTGAVVRLVPKCTVRPQRQSGRNRHLRSLVPVSPALEERTHA